MPEWPPRMYWRGPRSVLAQTTADALSLLQCGRRSEHTWVQVHVADDTSAQELCGGMIWSPTWPKPQDKHSP